MHYHLFSYWPPPVWRQHLFCNGFFRIDSVETLTRDVYWSAVEHPEEIYWVLAPQKIWGPKTTYFRRLRKSVATLMANITGKEHDIYNRKPALETTKSPLYRPKLL